MKSNVLKFPAQTSLETVRQAGIILNYVEDLLNKLDQYRMIDSRDVYEKLEEFRFQLENQIQE